VAINTLDAFLRDMRERYPETGAASTEANDATAPAKPRAAAPSPKAPAVPPKADALPTGSIVPSRAGVL
jgi:hypothetical protein